jgi:hypothetical protein
MKERRYRLLLVEAVGRGEGKRVDAIEISIRSVPHEVLDTLDNLLISGLAQGSEKLASLVHGAISSRRELSSQPSLARL